MYEFVESWSNNSKVIDKIKEYLPSYLSQFKLEDQPIICKLLENVEYYSEDELESISIEYFKVIDRLCAKIKTQYVVSTIFQDDKINHNTTKIISWCPKHINVMTNISKCDLKEVSNLILIDDYCGSGETVLNTLKYIEEQINNNLKVFYCPIFITSVANNRLNSQKYNHIKLVIVDHIINKAQCLSVNSIFTDKEKEQFIRICYEKNIGKIYGYNLIEDKFATRIFTPNNSLGILWYSERLYKPLFRREGQRLEKNYKYLSNEQINEFKEIIIRTDDKERLIKAKFAFLLYKNYNLDEIEYFLGINCGKIILKNLLEEKVLRLSNNRYCFYKNLGKYFREEKLNTYIEFGIVITKQDEIENKLRGLIA